MLTKSIKCNSLISLLILALMFVLSQSAPQNNYAYNRYYGYYPYRRSGYSRKPQAQTQTQSQSLKRQSTAAGTGRAGSSYDAYSMNLLNSLNAALKAQNESNKLADANKKRISKADEENAKFAGANNQEAEEESTRTALLLGNRLRRCFPFGRDAATATAATKSTATPKEQARFLFDLNVYNVYPNGGAAGLGGGYGCGGGGGLGGGLLGGGLLSDALADAYAPPATPLQNFLTLFAPGILQNSLAATVRPRPQLPVQSDPTETDPAVDPAFNQRPQLPVRRPNRVYFDSAGATPVTPAQLIGGVATTINGIIQQLTGNIQPVYPAYRSRSFG